jgi:cytochrome P450
MFAAILISLAALPVALVVWSLASLNVNLRKARAIGLPILVRYVTPTNPLWMIFGSNLVRLARKTGLATEHFDRFYLFGWDANERYRVHAEFGDAFTLVSPGGNWLYIADPKTAWDVLRRPGAYGRNIEQLAVLNVYGKNLSTTEGREWQKHRKVTASTFTERNNELVWQSSLAQGRQMLEYWLNRAPQPIRSVTDDCKTFSLNVLAAALFTKPYAFEGQEEMKKRLAGSVDPPDDSHQYRDSFSKILRGIIPIAIFGGETLKNSSWMPTSMKEVGEAVENFRSYVQSMITEEQSNVEKNVSTRKDMLSALVRASLAQQNDGRDMTITEQDIISNTFVYGFAGNDTTAITLAHIIVNLAANPATQDWIREEIRYYCMDASSSNWSYATWTKLRRCQAVVVSIFALGSLSLFADDVLDGNPATLPSTRVVVKVDQSHMSADGRKQYVHHSTAVQRASKLLRPAYQRFCLG